MTGQLCDRVQLMKPAVSLLGAGAALLGYCAQARTPGAGACALALSMLFLSGGAAALNNVQDLRLDSRMRRTRARPLPAGRIPASQGLAQSAVMIAAGLAGLAFSGPSPLPLLAGLAALALYNGIYTPLKQKTHLAMVPGVLCGMLPPLIGWLAAGGGLWSPRIWHIMALLGLWQVPHTWLVLLSCREDIPAPGIPTILDVFSAAQVERLMCVWISAFAVLTLLCMHLFSPRPAGGLHLPVLANALAMPALFAVVLYAFRGSGKYRLLFHYLTASMAAIIAAAVIDALLRTRI